MHTAQGSWQGAWFLWPVTVYIEDVDAGGVVYHPNHLKYIERARTEMWRSQGLSHGAQIAAPENPSAIVVANLSISYLRPLFLEQALVVATRITDIRSAGVNLLQEIRTTEGQVAARCEVALVQVSLATKRPLRWPQNVMALLSTHDPSQDQVAERQSK